MVGALLSDMEDGGAEKAMHCYRRAIEFGAYTDAVVSLA